MRTRRPAGGGRDDGDRGSAVVEFVTLTGILLMPAIYLMLTLLSVQRTQYAVTQAVREAGRVLATTGDRGATDTAIRLAFTDQGLNPQTARTSIACSPGCTAPTARIDVRITTRVTLPLVPDWMAGRPGTSLAVSATHTSHRDAYRATAGRNR